MKPLKKIAFLLEEFALATPSQQLLDRFLIGYPREGRFHRLDGCQVVVHAPARNAELERRIREFELVVESDMAQAVAGANAIVVAGRNAAAPNETFIEDVLRQITENCACFIYGALASSLDRAKDLARLAASRKCSLLAGTPLPVTWRLPEVELQPGTPLRAALIVVQGESRQAELDGLEGLCPIIERRAGGESGVRRVRFLLGEDLWKAGKDGLWSWPLLASALSRSNAPQGDALKDARTQDLVGLGLVPHLARRPRGWILEHRDELRSVLLALDGVVADYHFAVQTDRSEIVSAQIYRPPAPADDQFSRLAAAIEDFFRTGKAPWPVERNILIAGLLEVFRKGASEKSGVFETPGLAIQYSR